MFEANKSVENVDLSSTLQYFVKFTYIFSLRLDCYLDDSNSQILEGISCSPSVKTLNLFNNSIQISGAQSVMTSLMKVPAISSLNVMCNKSIYMFNLQI